MNDSGNVSPVFIESRPDFGREILLTASYRVSVNASRNQGEQRARWAMRPRFSFAYQVAALPSADFAQRRASLLAELTSPIVVPIWTDEFTLSSMTSAHVANLGVQLAKKKFKVGSFAYFVQGGNATFRKILTVGSTSLTFVAESVPTYTAGALVYPCILGLRGQESQFTANLVSETDETISVEEL